VIRESFIMRCVRVAELRARSKEYKVQGMMDPLVTDLEAGLV
jgi:hypothetical protein